MKHRFVFHSLMLLAVFLALTSTALASSTWYVNGVNGSNNHSCKTVQTACKTIGHAISLASSGDSIMVAAATYKENLSIGLSLKLLGSAAKTTIIDGGGKGNVVTISNADADVVLSSVTIQHGSAVAGGGIYNYGILSVNNSTVANNGVSSKIKYPSFGGGIYNGGTLTINRSFIAQNKAQGNCFFFHVCQTSSGGGISNSGTLTINRSFIAQNKAQGTCFFQTCLTSSGGGISNSGTPIINDSTLSGNAVVAGNFSYGGGIDSGGILTINNSTISGNGAEGVHGVGVGGGIYSYNTLTISNSTISGNSASSGGGILNRSGFKVALKNSIVANNSGSNCGGTIVSHGYNLSSDSSCAFSNSGDRDNTNPVLGRLGYYGGPTPTIPLLTGSPAIDEGNPSGCANSNGVLLKTDQRGKPRPDKEDTGGCDMGAYERQKD